MSQCDGVNKCVKAKIQIIKVQIEINELIFLEYNVKPETQMHAIIQIFKIYISLVLLIFII